MERVKKVVRKQKKEEIMEEKNHYFISKTSIYDYAMILHLCDSNHSDKTVLVKVTNNEKIGIYSTDTPEGKKEMQDFQKVWTSSDSPYRETNFHQIIMSIKVQDKMPEVIKAIADVIELPVDEVEKTV